MESNNSWNKLEQLQLEKLNQMLFNHHPDAVYVLTLEGEFYMVNKGICQITGRSRDQLLGSSFTHLLHPDFIGDAAERFKKAVQGEPQRCETAIITVSGEVVHLDVTNFTLKIEDKTVGVLGIAKGVNEKHQREKVLRDAATVLKAQNEELEIFRKIIAHDMRSPISNAIGFAKLLLDAHLTQEAEKEVKSLLLRTVESLDSMIRDLNEVISLRAAGDEVKESVNVAAEIDKVILLYKEEINKINASVHVDVPSQLSVVTVKAYFDSIIRNLLSNALKYRSQERVPIITIAVSATTTHLQLSVKDNGIGMDMSKVSNDLFKMQKRFAPSVADGKGLGLYIMHEQVKLLGGYVTVDSSPGQGTAFNVFLPLV